MKVAILTPTRDSRVHVDHALSVMRTVLSAPQGVEMSILPLKGQANLPRARNQLVAQALHWGADRLWFIDDDISFDEKDFWRITARPEIFVAGLPQRRPGDLADLMNRPMLMGSFEGNEPPEPDDEGLVEALKVPTAFLCLDREVFDELKPESPDFDLPQLPPEVNQFLKGYFSFSHESDFEFSEGHMHGEDYFISKRWRSLGHKIWVDAAVRLGHHEGLIGLTLSYMDVLNARKAHKAAEKDRKDAA